MQSTRNPYLEGNFGPVDYEVTSLDLKVTGSIPEGLDGRYLRNGPNPVTAPDPGTYNWFTGDGMVHGVRLRDGRAEWYRNRWIRVGAVPAALGEPDPGGPTTDGADFAPNTNVIGFNGSTFAIVEAGSKPVQLDDELNTLGRCDFAGTLPNGFSAHPKLDPRTGHLHVSSYFWARPEIIEYVVVGPEKTVVRREDIEVPGNPMVHDMSITENHAVFFDLPVTFDMDAAIGGAKLPYTWNPDYGARLGVLPFAGTGVDAIKWFEIEPCYVFHPANAYEELDEHGDLRIVLEVIRYSRMFDKDRLGPSDGTPTLWRWTIDTASGRMTETQLDDRPSEFPRVDERLLGTPHRYSFSVGVETGDDGVTFDGSQIFCRDSTTGTVRSHEFDAAEAAGEAVFVPATADAGDLDGYLMSLVYDHRTDSSDLVILAAEDIEGEPLARIHLPQRVPFGFHGNWVPT